MRIFETVFILALFLTGQILTGCTSQTSDQSAANKTTAAEQRTEAENSNTAKDNIEELGSLINLPVEPEEAAWKESPAGNDSTKKLIAVLRYSDADAEMLSTRLSRQMPPTAETISTEEWFPAELIAQGELSGESSVTGKTYAGDDFYSAPYSEGKITRIDTTNYFVLQLFAK